MNFIRNYAWQNTCRRLYRSIPLLFFASLFATAVFGGTVFTHSMQEGVKTLEERLGADIIVVPSKARMHFDINSVLMQGTLGYFYMDRDIERKISEIEGIDKVSSQIYLASLVADCCSLPLQIIGFDPATDFAIQPWIKETYQGEIGEGDIVVGSNIVVPEDRRFSFYDVECRVVAKLAPTGSSLDNSVYTNADTVRKLVASSQSKGLNEYNSIDPDKVVSTVLVKVRSGESIEQVSNRIKSNIRKIKVAETKELISNISESLTSLSSLVDVVIVAIWGLCLVAMAIVFTLLTNERKKEFATLRVVGLSKAMLAKLVITEAVIINIIGSTLGIILSTGVIMLFTNAISLIIGVPFLFPSTGDVIVLIILTVFASVAIGAVIAAWSAYRISSLDTSLILREGD